MKRLVLTLVLGLSAMVWAVGGDMGNGDGSEGNPYLIEDLADFDAFAANSAYWAAGVHTKLMTDIDLAGRIYTAAVIAPDTSTSGGFQGTPFAGVFDGGGNSFFNLQIDSSTADYVGLFGKADFAEIKNLIIENVNIQADETVGTLVGYNNASNINNCYSSGSISGSSYIGGFVGVNIGGIISDCHSSGQISGNYCIGGFTSGANGGSIITQCSSNMQMSVTNNTRLVGGFVGSHAQFNNTIQNCVATGTIITGNECDSIGGFAGSNNGTVKDCFANSIIETGDSCYNIGGLAGANFEGMLMNSYSEGVVTCNSNNYNVGGLTGAGPGTGPNRGIEKCYSHFNIILPSEGYDYIGGLVGRNYGGPISSVYFLETCGPDNGIGTPLDNSNMMIQTNFVGWDFSDSDGDAADWMMLREGEDYPRLAWQAVFGGDVAGLYGVDMVDMAYLARYWGLDDCGGVDDCGRADIDGSGDVGIGDLAAVAEDWLRGI